MMKKMTQNVALKTNFKNNNLWLSHTKRRRNVFFINFWRSTGTSFTIFWGGGEVTGDHWFRVSTNQNGPQQCEEECGRSSWMRDEIWMGRPQGQGCVGTPQLLNNIQPINYDTSYRYYLYDMFNT